MKKKKSLKKKLKKAIKKSLDLNETILLIKEMYKINPYIY